MARATADGNVVAVSNGPREGPNPTTLMLNEERRAIILELLQEQGRVEVRDLSRRFSTTEATVRSDLKALQALGLVKRAHGGAIRLDAVAVDPSLREKAKLHAEEKRRIGIAAAALVEDGDTIILDSGTTTRQIATNIKNRRGLTVITNGINIASELIGAPGIQLILLGGTVRASSNSVVGQFAVGMLRQLSADRLFLGADACDLGFGLTTPNLEEAAVNQAMIQIAREKIVVADASKFGRRSLARIVSLFEMDAIITDASLPAPVQDELTARGVRVVIA